MNKMKPIKIKYRQKSLKNAPHFVKTSGGRSSAFMLLGLLEQNLLSMKRGDVVVFNNTSAEHPETYEFIAKLKNLVEETYGIPFFLTEFATYEDISDGNWLRYPTFRLVNDRQKSDENPDGFHGRGEVFEELLSHTAFLPNRHRRISTSAMKIKVTEQFLSSWFACEEQLEYLGHYGTNSKMTDEGICVAHCKNGGKTPDDILLKKRAFVRNRPFFRPEQNFQDFTKVDLTNRQITLMEIAAFGGNVDLRCREFPVEYVSLVGLRADEPERLKRLNARICGDTGKDESKPNAEKVNTPLADNNITKIDVNLFWSNQSWDLGLKSDTNLTNCTFCFLKGSKALQEVANELKYAASKNEYTMTPMDIKWWERIEKEYGRDLIKEERRKTNNLADVSFIGFFGENAKISFKRLNDFTNGQITKSEFLDNETEILACNCTD